MTKFYIITKNNYYHIDYACILYSKFQLCHKSRHGAVAQEKRSCCGFDSRNESFYILFPDKKAKGYSVRQKKRKKTLRYLLHQMVNQHYFHKAPVVLKYHPKTLFRSENEHILLALEIYMLGADVAKKKRIN